MSDDARTPPPIDVVDRLVGEGSFEEVMRALEDVVAHLEHGKLTLDESLAWYEAGLRLSRRCADLLEQAELRVLALDREYASSRDTEGAIRSFLSELRNSSDGEDHLTWNAGDES
jgi:exodeoxyribonuclease VII small subunit